MKIPSISPKAPAERTNEERALDYLMSGYAESRQAVADWADEVASKTTGAEYVYMLQWADRPYKDAARAKMLQGFYQHAYDGVLSGSSHEDICQEILRIATRRTIEMAKNHTRSSSALMNLMNECHMEVIADFADTFAQILLGRW